MITGAPAPSPTFLGGDRFLACGRLAFGPFTLGRVPAVGARPRALPILRSPRLRPVHAGPSARGGRPDPRTSHLVVASPSARSRWAECPRWAPGPAPFPSCGRLAFGPFTLGRVPAVGARTRALPILWSPRLRPVHAGPSARGGRPDPRPS